MPYIAGLDGEEAKAQIAKDLPGLNVVLVPKVKKEKEEGKGDRGCLSPLRSRPSHRHRPTTHTRPTGQHVHAGLPLGPGAGFRGRGQQSYRARPRARLIEGSKEEVSESPSNCHRCGAGDVKDKEREGTGRDQKATHWGLGEGSNAAACDRTRKEGSPSRWRRGRQGGGEEQSEWPGWGPTTGGSASK